MKAHKTAATRTHRRITWFEARRRNELAKARLQELKLKVREGELVERKAMDDVGFKTAREVRDTLANIPSRLSGPLAAETDQHKIHDMLTKEINQCLEGLADEKNTEPLPPDRPKVAAARTRRPRAATAGAVQSHA